MDLGPEPLRAMMARIPQMRDGEALKFCEELGAAVQQHFLQPSEETPSFLAAAYEALKSVPPAQHPASVAASLIAIGHYYGLSSNPVPGLAPAADAVAAAKLAQDQPLVMKSLRVLGWLLADSGNFPDAVASVTDAMRMAQALRDTTAECACWNLLGVFFLHAGQASEAITYFERAIELAGDDPACRAYREVAYSNTATAALEVGDLRRAFPAAQMGVADDAEPQNAVEADTRAMREQIFARVLAELGDLDRAVEYLAKAQQHAAQAGTDRSKLNVASTQALIEIASGRKDIGLTRIKQTLETARGKSKGNLPAILSDCVAAYERAGQPDVALTMLHDLLDHKKESTQAQILMHYRMAAARIARAEEVEDGRAAALTHQHTQLRGQMKDRELIRRNLRLLEEQSVAAELHDDATGEHCYRVGRLASILGREIGLEDDICFLIDHCARLHDIGKLVVPDAILLKPGKLTPGEREIMQRHTTAGAEILGRISLPQIHVAEAIARHHHERWDGNGYPDRLAGSAIPLHARVTALADVYDALTHKRPYKDAWPVHAALAEIKELSGKQFDPEMTAIFLDLVPRLQREHGDLDVFLAADAKDADFIKARRSIAAALKGNDPAVSLFDLRR
jgi:putative two-component system response regulator